MGLSVSSRSLGAAQGRPREEARRRRLRSGCWARVGRWASGRRAHPVPFPPELTYQEVLSFKPAEPPQAPGSLEIEQ